MQERRKAIIENYIRSYNAFDVAGMIQDLAPQVVFENITDGQVTLKTEGVNAFKKQAEFAKSVFHDRKQTINSWEYDNAVIKVSISYLGTLAVDLPNGPKAGDTLELQGTSYFEFIDDRITRITDIS